MERMDMESMAWAPGPGRPADCGEDDHFYFPGFGLVGYIKYDEEHNVWLPFYKYEDVEHLAHKLCEPLIVKKELIPVLDALSPHLISIASCYSKDDAKAQVQRYFTSEVLPKLLDDFSDIPSDDSLF